MKQENFIKIYDNVFSPEHCQKLIDCFKSNAYVYSHQKDKEILNPDYINKHNDSGRVDKSIFLGDVELGAIYSNEFYSAMDESVNEYCNSFPILRESSFASYSIKIQETKQGEGFHTWHCEKATWNTRNRLLVWSVYLNDIKSGGETEFLYQSLRIKPKQGTVVIWPSGFTHTHRGNPPLDDETKYIATGWYMLNPADG